ncbi:MAG: hypothetical protein ACR2GY_06285 [Phycisphaerales bacterium]
MSRSLVIATAAVIVITIATVAVVRTVWRPVADPVTDAFERTRPAMEAIKMVGLGSRDVVDSALQLMTIQGTLTAPQRSSLADLLGDAIEYYHIHESPEAYKGWRRQSGSRLRSMEDMNGPGVWALESSVLYINDEIADQGFRIEPAEDVEGYFDQLWQARRKCDDGAHLAVEMAADPAGMLAVVRPDALAVGSQEFFEGELGNEGWFGGVSTGSRTWYHDPRIETLQSESGIGVHVGIIFEFADGMRRPLHFLCVWDGRQATWRLQSVVMTNRPRKHTVWPWEL